MFKSEINRQKLKEKYGDEIIYVYPREIFADIENLFSPQDEKFLSEINDKGFCISRFMAEYNSEIYQPIPYIIIINSRTREIFVTRRIGGEERLLNKFSFIGGHTNYVDAKIGNAIMNAAYRELGEEIFYTPTKGKNLKFLGTLKDENSNTSEHIGFIFIQEVDNAHVREVKNLEGIWLSIDEAVKRIDEFESWGQILIDEMKRG